MPTRGGNAPGQPGWKKTFPHLGAGGAAIFAAVVLLAVLEWRSAAGLKRFGPRLAALNLPEETRGSLLQRQLWQRRDCLPVYGSSELSIAQPTRADLFFSRRRQGFDVCLVGQTGDRCLILLQELAALGKTAQGKKAVVFLSPVWFLPSAESAQRDHSLHNQFAATFSPLQIGETVVDSPIKPLLRRQIADRLLVYDGIIRARSPLLVWALTNLNKRAWVQQRWFDLLDPLLVMQNEVWEMQERFHWLELIHQRPALRPAGVLYKSRCKRLDWTQLGQEIDRMEAKTGAVTFYSRGVASDKRVTEADEPEHVALHLDRDADFLRRMESAPEWGDLELLLRTAKELRVRLLLIDQPINGRFSDRQGVTPAARRVYYDRVGRLAAAYHVPVRDFSEYEEDRSFFRDVVHPSAKAWVFYDQALEEFYHHKKL